MHRYSRLIVAFFTIAVLFSVTGCKKKVAPPPPATTAPTPSPTAQISVTPSSAYAGDKVTLSWSSTNATSVNISDLGSVANSGEKVLTADSSTNFHMEAKGDGGTATADARLTVNAAPVSSTPVYTETEEQVFKAHVKDIFFDYDKYTVRKSDEEVLVQDAAFLRDHPNEKIVIGGYCDERGSNEYNLALGQNRAEAAQKMLVAAGIKADRIRVISYGKEKPFCTESTEACWQENRRAGFSLAQ